MFLKPDLDSILSTGPAATLSDQWVYGLCRGPRLADLEESGPAQSTCPEGRKR